MPCAHVPMSKCKPTLRTRLRVAASTARAVLRRCRRVTSVSVSIMALTALAAPAALAVDDALEGANATVPVGAAVGTVAVAAAVATRRNTHRTMPAIARACAGPAPPPGYVCRGLPLLRSGGAACDVHKAEIGADRRAARSISTAAGPFTSARA